MLQELRDVSGMATEYFEDVIAPSLKQRMLEYPVQINTLVNRYDLDNKKSKGTRLVSMLSNDCIDLMYVFISDPKTPSVPALEMALLREACLKNNRNILKMEKKYTKMSRKVRFCMIIAVVVKSDCGFMNFVRNFSSNCTKD